MDSIPTCHFWIIFYPLLSPFLGVMSSISCWSWNKNCTTSRAIVLISATLLSVVFAFFNSIPSYSSPISILRLLNLNLKHCKYPYSTLLATHREIDNNVVRLRSILISYVPPPPLGTDLDLNWNGICQNYSQRVLDSTLISVCYFISFSPNSIPITKCLPLASRQGLKLDINFMDRNTISLRDQENYLFDLLCVVFVHFTVTLFVPRS